uniref:Uncharacterized protein n=1 Tax=Tanacetum cinerariifolium TaxID=118510 RepID=A0A6L2ML56_TANCI|nr:hypothetical protein [Tanacetum cinerariifolium]
MYDENGDRGERRQETILHTLCILNSGFNMVGEVVELTNVLQDLIPTHDWLRLSTHPTSSPKEVDWEKRMVQSPWKTSGTVPLAQWNQPVLQKGPVAAAMEMTKALEHPLCLLEFKRLSSFDGWKLVDVDNRIKHSPKSSSLGERDHDVIHKVVKIRDGIRMSGADMLKEAYGEHSIRKNHHVALGIENNLFAFDFTGFPGGLS